MSRDALRCWEIPQGATRCLEMPREFFDPKNNCEKNALKISRHVTAFQDITQHLAESRSITRNLEATHGISKHLAESRGTSRNLKAPRGISRHLAESRGTLRHVNPFCGSLRRLVVSNSFTLLDQFYDIHHLVFLDPRQIN
jgi:hypothetical protein